MQDNYQTGQTGPNNAKGRLAIVTGGVGPERSGALLSGRHVAEACNSLGIATSVYDSAELDFSKLVNCRGAFLTTHGWYGEDGKLQGVLDLLRVPYSGSGVAASAAAYFKPFANAIAVTAGLRVPKSHLVDMRFGESFDASYLYANLGPQIFVKPASNGCSLGAQILDSSAATRDWLSEAATTECPIYVAAKYINGRDVSAGVIEIDGVPTILPLLETRHLHQFYSHQVKRDSSLREHICPANISPRAEQQLRTDALLIYKALGCRGFARIDFIVSGDIVWFLEVNSLPGFSRNGNLAQMGYAHGWTYSEMIARLISTMDPSSCYRP
ncbi:D-alanine--D-alanine ligase [Pandoraea pneumonica]|uniref:D-alanine--D-alanine ligase n=1 Tax=Pandoraea pneumonica TaxID=2508299 RepID=A0A5E4Z1I9_9BURK|nr:hypothetical protein [Pandoraea pneumonica]VVE54542.1 D-alanine--D-alanine ligase [Pandoraea pneumonica]